MGIAIKISLIVSLATFLAFESIAQDVPANTTHEISQSLPALQLHNGTYSRLPYTLSIPDINPPAFNAFDLNDSVGIKNISTSHFIGTPQPSGQKFNFNNNFNLSFNNSAGIIHAWDNGAILGSSSYNTFTGMGNIASGSFLLTQDFGRFNFTGSVTGSKFHLDRNLYNDFNLSGRLSYRLSDRIYLNVFGNYSTGNIYHSMAAMPFLPSTSYGGSMSIVVSDKFNLEVGANRYYDPFSKKWITRPVLVPTIDINGTKIGVDVGGLIYDIIQSIVAPDYSPSWNGIPGPMMPRPGAPMPRPGNFPPPRR